MRDFTFVDDVAQGVVLALDRPPPPDPGFDKLRGDPAASDAPYRVFNIGNHRPVQLADFIAAIEGQVGKPAIRRWRDIQPGDVAVTCADVDVFAQWTGFRPGVAVDEGVRRFVAWFRDYYRV